jgi:hypothetical protein
VEYVELWRRTQHEDPFQGMGRRMRFFSLKSLLGRRQANDFPIGWQLKKESWNFPPPVLSRVPPANAARRVLVRSCAKLGSTGPSISESTTGGSPCRTAGQHWLSPPHAGGSSPSCRRDGSHGHRILSWPGLKLHNSTLADRSDGHLHLHRRATPFGAPNLHHLRRR